MEPFNAQKPNSKAGWLTFSLTQQKGEHMEYYVLTQSGREAIPVLHKTEKNDEANILEYLGKADGATVEQVADEMHLDEKTAYDKLRSLSANRWVWRKTTKLTPF